MIVAAGEVDYIALLVLFELLRGSPTSSPLVLPCYGPLPGNDSEAGNTDNKPQLGYSHA